MVLLVGVLVENGVAFSLVHKAVSHVLVLLKSDGDSDVLLDSIHHFLPFFILLLLIDLRFLLCLLDELVLDLKDLVNELHSGSFDFTIEVIFDLGFVSEVVSERVKSGADLLSEAHQRAGRSDRVKEFEYVTRRHILL